ncbi:MAG: HAMP domain-containing histidine kinase [Lachnospiraceae bacterium]|nr:HAMP domain-containing histidine kinase [Lachnospiraceae bacterium]
MKFSYKILLCTIIIMAAAFGFSGFYFVNFVFETSMEREVDQAMDDSSILQFAFETAALNIPSKYNVLQDAAVAQIGAQLERGGQGRERLLRFSDEEMETLFVSQGFTEDASLLESVGEEAIVYQVIQLGSRYYVHTAMEVQVLNRVLFLETMRDITEVFKERALGFDMYRKVTLLMLGGSCGVMFFLSVWLTRPIRLLTRATKKMAEGDYEYRAKKISNDELGKLTEDFNRMAGALEENVDKLKQEIQAREEFIGAFAHELKTPLTAIIGYADLLRSRKLDEEKHFLSANYIYTEGKRLETMSFRLLDIIVTKRGSVNPQEVTAEDVFTYVQDAFAEHTQQKLVCEFQAGKIYGEMDLIKSVLLNLVDNACKASGDGAIIEVLGEKQPGGYLIKVRDYGVGIPKEEQQRITEAFYMVDKSRSRSRNGAGLGLALCVEILRLHGSELCIDSEPGKGTTMSFLLPEKQEGTNEENNH